MIEAISARLREILEAAGAGSIAVNKIVAGASSHYMGTCRGGLGATSSGNVAIQVLNRCKN
jgi:hypothetical protein